MHTSVNAFARRAVLARLSAHSRYRALNLGRLLNRRQVLTSAYQRALADYQTGELILVFGSFVTVADVLAEQN